MGNDFKDKLRRIANGLTTILCGFVCEFCHGTVLYVDVTARGPGNGTKECPFSTISEAAKIAMPGDTVEIAPGIYREAVELPRGGTNGAPIVFRAKKPGTVTICGSEQITTWKPYLLESGKRIDGVFACDYYYESSTSLESANPKKPPHYKEVLHLPNWLRSDLVSIDGRLLMPVDTKGNILASREWTFFVDREATPPQLIIKVPSDFNLESSIVEVGVRSTLFNKTNNADATHISLNGLRFLHAANDVQTGMVWARSSWNLENCVLEGSNGVGLKILGKDIVVRSCKFLRNGSESFDPHASRNILIEGCEFAFNGWRGFNHSWGVSNKVFDCQDVTIRDCKSYWNCGPGIWIDWKNRNILIERCEIFGNYGVGEPHSGSGIFVEANFGPVYLLNNIIWSNTGPGIYLAESENVTVEGNVLADNESAVSFRTMVREDPDGKPFSLKDIVIRNNKILSQRTKTFNTTWITKPVAKFFKEEVAIESNIFDSRITFNELKPVLGNRVDSFSSHETMDVKNGSFYFDKPLLPTKQRDILWDNQGRFPSKACEGIAGNYVLPVFSRTEIVTAAPGINTCQLMDIIGETLFVEITSAEDLEMIARIPTISLTEPVPIPVTVTDGKAFVDFPRSKLKN